jgi:hypothetical protein
MKPQTLLTLFIVGLLLTSCKDVTEKQLNKDDFATIKERIEKSDTLTSGKKRYIIDNLSMMLGFSELGKAINPSIKDSIPTFKEQIVDFGKDYDKKYNEILTNIENNKKLKGLLTLKGAEVFGAGEYKASLFMTFDCNNQFDKPILYAILNYKYIDKYDTKYFDEKVKLADKYANDFKTGEIKIGTNEQYNDVAKFVYTKVPSRTYLKDNGKRANEFMMEGLKVEVLGVVFADKSEITFGDETWDYMK